ncbi:amino acid ABC transporter permease [Nonomuraea sp. NEAU-A123]|uniref:amino acid ABC transporter permease n=1 Tax=Nonomuraea sp. NEAU-A123 TaxID=2839649 RepID=UPI001BE40CC0|nr:amino acid ABC transporter permease [Nonomuraea sp. NEAU-A123]MBT2229596.1 amino acid ABC transporter permease [Nonomuraea sp. NEAU-A123]
MSSSVLFDTPGPRGRVRNHLITGISALVLLAALAWVLLKFNEKGQFDGKIWAPFTTQVVWVDFILPGLVGTLTAAALGAVFALLFGAVFGIARLSDHRWIRIPAAWIVELFRAIPLLLLIFFIWFLSPDLFGGGDYALFAIVLGLTLYNGSVLAEVVRAGINSIPKGQSEAAYAVGLRKGGVMRLILLPQGLTVMMPAVVSQLVVLLKDTALGYFIVYVDLLNMGFKTLPSVYPGTKLVSAIVIGVIYIIMAMALSAFATWLEKRSRRSRKTTAKPIEPPGAVAGLPSGQPTPDGAVVA